MKKHLEILIKGEKWKVYLQTNAAFKRLNGSDCFHICYPEEKAIYYNKSYLTFDLIVHEIAHAFIWATDTEHSVMSAEAVEELCITTISKNYFEIGKAAQDVLNFSLKE